MNQVVQDLLIVLLFGALVYVLLAFAVWMLVSVWLSVRDERNLHELTRQTIEGFRLGTTTDLPGVEILFTGIYGRRQDAERRGFIRRAMADGISWIHDKERRRKEHGLRKLDDAALRALAEFLVRMKGENERVEPFAEVPPEERAMLHDIATLATGSRSAKAIKAKLDGLASVITAKDRQLQKVARFRKWAAVLGPIGVVAGLVKVGLTLFG